MNYSEQELIDRAFILRRCCVTEEDMPMYDSIFENPENTFSTSMMTLTPSSRCSDGKFRSFFEYIDFLFPNPILEALVESSNTLSRVFKTTLDFSTLNNITIRMTRV